MISNNGYLLGPFAAFFSSVTWAVGTSAYSKLTKQNSAFAINFTRAICALPCFLLLAIVQSGGFREFWIALTQVQLSHLGWYTTSILASYAFGDCIFFWSALRIGVSAALAISSIFPIWTAIAGFLFQGQILSGLQIAGLVVAVAGVVIVILSAPKSQSVSAQGKLPRSEKRNLWLGVGLALISSLMWSINSYAVSRGGQGILTSVGSSVRMTIGVALIYIVSQMLGYRGPMLVPRAQIRPLAWAFLFEVFLGSYFYMYGMAHAPLAIGAALTSLAPVISVPVAVALKIERFSILRTSGICLVVIGLCFLVGLGASLG